MVDWHDAFALSVSESKALLDSGFHVLDSGFHVPYMFFVGRTCFLGSNRYWNSAGRRKVFPDSEFYRQKSGRQESGFLYMGRHSFTWGDI